VTQVGEQLEGSPEALHHSMHKRALVFLQAMIRQALTKGQALAKVCDDGRCPSFPKVYLIDSTGCGLPDILQDLSPGAGGSAAKAGATMQAVWDDKSRVFGHGALTPWTMPANTSGDPVVA